MKLGEKWKERQEGLTSTWWAKWCRTRVGSENRKGSAQLLDISLEQAQVTVFGNLIIREKTLLSTSQGKEESCWVAIDRLGGERTNSSNGKKDGANTNKEKRGDVRLGEPRGRHC